MILTPAYAYSADEDILEKLSNHSRNQTSLGKSIQSTTISGIQVNNCFDKYKTIIFMRTLMVVESITEKKIVKVKLTSSFKGKLFYAIIPDKAIKTVTLYYSRANDIEGKSVTRGLLLFIRDFFKLEPAFFSNKSADG